MGLLRNIREFRDGASEEHRVIGGVPWRPWDSPLWRFDIGGPVHPSHAYYGEDNALGLPALYAGCKILADGAASLPIRVYQNYRDHDGQRRHRLYEGPTFFEKPSVTGTVFDWVFAGIASLVLHGNAWGLVTGRDGYGFPTGIEWIPPEHVWVENDQKQPMNPMRTKVFVYGREMTWTGPDAELFHVRAFTLPGRLEGLSVLRAFALTVMAGQEAQRYGTDWYRTGGFPPGTFHNKELEIDPDQAAQIRAMLVASLRRREPLVYGRDWDYCCDAETEMLTRSGWKRYDQVTDGDECLSLNPETGMSEWQPVDHLYTFDGPHDVIEMSSSSHSSVTTGRHRWPVVKRKTGAIGWTTTETMAQDDRVVRAAPVVAPAEAKWADSLVELVAWLWTEGHIRPGGMVEIEQSWKVNPGNVARIRAALTGLLGAPVASLRPESARMSWREDRHGGLTRFRLGAGAGKLLAAHAPARVVSTPWLAELTRAQLELFIQVSVDADGWRRPNGARRITQGSRERLEAFRVACVLAGHAGSIHEVKPGTWALEVDGSTRCAPAQPQGKRAYSFNGIVWCPATRHANWLARRRGTTYFTGNTPVTVPPSEAQFIDSMQLNATQIAAILNLPPDRLGGKKGDSLSYANQQDSTLQILEALRPWLVRLEHAFSDLLPRNRFVRFYTDALLKTDLKTRVQIYETQRNIGLRTVDEIRELEDLPPFPGQVGNESMPLQLMTALGQRAGALPKSMQDQVIFLMDRATAQLVKLQKEHPELVQSPGHPPAQDPSMLAASMFTAYARSLTRDPSRGWDDDALFLRQLGDRAMATQSPEYLGAWIPDAREHVMAAAHDE